MPAKDKGRVARGDGYGYFTADGSEYVVTRADTPRPWCNRFGNREYALVLSQRGGGYAIAGDTTRCQLTWYVPRFDEAGRYLYLRDSTGAAWNAHGGPGAVAPDHFACRHGLGWTTYETRHGAIACASTLFVPLSGPVEIWRVTLRNSGRTPRTVTAFPYVEWSLDDDTQSVDDLVYAAYSEADYEAATGAIVAARRELESFSFRRAFMTMDARPDSWEANRAAFVGPRGATSAPRAVLAGRCANTPAEAEIAIGAFAKRWRLAPGAEVTFHVMIGLAQTRAARAGLRRRLLAPGAPARELRRVKEFWAAMPERFALRTPDEDLNRYVNAWLVKHVQVQGATHAIRQINVGYRNHVQDALGMLLLDPARARELLVEAAQHHFTDGDTAMHWSAGRAKARRKSHVDTKVWFVLALCAYLRETGDLTLLDECSPCVDDARPLSVRAKMERILAKSWKDRGLHGLSLIGAGDWNDNLSGMGKEGRGVSLWMSEAVCLMLQEAAELYDFLGEGRAAALWRRRARALATAIDRHGWDGDWYVQGFDDAGAAVGTRREREGRIFLLPQVWAVMAGVAPPARQRRLWRAVERRLSSPFGPRLMERPYTRIDPAIGRITFLAPGMSENGPAYSHGGSFKIYADGLAGRGDALYDDVRRILPYAHDPARTLSEPFAIANFFRTGGPPRKEGATHRAWTTSTPNWILRALAEGMMGVRVAYRGFSVAPAIPRAWKRCAFRRTIRGAPCDIVVGNPDGVEHGVRAVVVDGRPVGGALIPFFGDRRKHLIEIVMGRERT